jgi:hypothetical protein
MGPRRRQVHHAAMKDTLKIASLFLAIAAVLAGVVALTQLRCAP